MDENDYAFIPASEIAPIHKRCVMPGCHRWRKPNNARVGTYTLCEGHYADRSGGSVDHFTAHITIAGLSTAVPATLLIDGGPCHYA